MHSIMITQREKIKKKNQNTKTTYTKEKQGLQK